MLNSICICGAGTMGSGIAQLPHKADLQQSYLISTKVQ
jgi:3-hydroxyacyl-CoA dehydrogenase